jgi:hypothetical protein
MSGPALFKMLDRNSDVVEGAILAFLFRARTNTGSQFDSDSRSRQTVNGDAERTINKAVKLRAHASNPVLATDPVRYTAREMPRSPPSGRMLFEAAQRWPVGRALHTRPAADRNHLCGDPSPHGSPAGGRCQEGGWNETPVLIHQRQWLLAARAERVRGVLQDMRSRQWPAYPST